MGFEYCAVVNCFNNSGNSKHLKFFRVPKDLKRRQQWLECMGRTDLTKEPEKTLLNRRVCSQHFHVNMLAGMCGSRLRKNAEPTLFEESQGFKAFNIATTSSGGLQNVPSDSPTTTVHDEVVTTASTLEPSQSDISDKGCQTPPELANSTPRKRALRAEIHNLKRRRICISQATQAASQPAQDDFTKENLKKFCMNTFSTGMANFFVMQIELASKKPKGCRYNDFFKQFALTVYFLGPSVYRFLKETFRLPSKSTLCRLTTKWDITSGFNEFIFQMVAMKVRNLNDKARDCILCADEMSLKTHLFYNRSKDIIIGFHQNNDRKSYSPANSALALMARGIHQNWKQPIAFFYVTNSCQVEYLQNIIFNAIVKLNHIGLRVRALITDQGSNFVKFSKDVGVTPDKPYFIVDSKRIFHLFDTPHLLKSTRNNFVKYTFTSDNDNIDFKYIEMLYNRDKEMSFRMVPKLTNAHLHPTPFQKMNVALAAQVLSSSVATGLETLISFGYLPQAAIGTAKFVSNIDKLFDVLNSYQYASKEFNRPFVGSSQQIIFLNSMKNEFKTLKITNSVGKDVTRTMKFLDGWQTTITGCLMLWEDLQPTTKVIFMRRLNQDCLENMFGSIRQKGGFNLNPTPIQFQYAFKKVFCLNFFRHVDGANCIPDIDDLLSTFKIEDATNATEVILANSLKENIFNEVLHINPNDYFSTELPAKNALAWVSGYLMKKCLTKHICELCEKFSQENSELLQNETMLCYFRAYENGQKNTFGNLTMPPNSFYLYVFRLDTTFCELFPKLSIEGNIGHKIKVELQKIPFVKPCEEFNIHYLLSLFVRMKVFYTLKYANRSFREQNHGRHSKTNKKVINLLHL